MGSISTADVAFNQEKPETTDRERRMESDFFFLHFRIKLSKWRRCKAKFSTIYVLSVGGELSNSTLCFSADLHSPAIAE